MLAAMKAPALTLLAAFASLSLAAENNDTKTSAGKFPSLAQCVSHLDLTRATKTPTGCQFWFVGRDLANGKTLKMSVVEPHKAIHAPHHHVEDEFYFILEGTAEFYLNGERSTGGPNTSFYCPSNSEHGISNAGDTELRYLVIKQYNPDNPNAAPTRS
jgi:mannose-6-phosphate isomerase-like protein (cupin superfamily)